MRNNLFALLLLAAASSHAAITVTDDVGNKVTLANKAQRIISMSPHVTEMLFAAGGGARIVGTSEYSDYPPEANQIPRVGSNSNLDIERVLSMRPDLIIVWHSGNTARQLEQLRALGIPMFYSEPARIDDVPSTLLRFGQLLGTEAVAQPVAEHFRAKMAQLAASYGKRAPVRVFYQIWDKPLYTLSDSSIVSDAIRMCGGVNVFGQLRIKAPQVSIEAVLQENPEAIFGGDQHDPADAGLNIWKPYKTLTAVQRGNLFTLGGELLTRAGPRMVQGAANMCEKLELARQRRK
jgi:iron complex transport system substrate-binding protein